MFPHLSKNRSVHRHAVGLNYDLHSGTAPLVSASELGAGADRAVAYARKWGVPVVENPALAEALSQLELSEEIPIELFEAVATVLAEVEYIRHSDKSG